MSSDGWALNNFFLGVYTFVPSEPGEYIYQIDLLDEHGDKKDFLPFWKTAVLKWFHNGIDGYISEKRLRKVPLKCIRILIQKLISTKELRIYFKRF